MVDSVLITILRGEQSTREPGLVARDSWLELTSNEPARLRPIAAARRVLRSPGHRQRRSASPVSARAPSGVHVHSAPQRARVPSTTTTAPRPPETFRLLQAHTETRDELLLQGIDLGMPRVDDASLGEKRFRRVGRVGLDGRRSSTKTSLNEAPAHPRLESLPLRRRGVGFHATHSCKDSSSVDRLAGCRRSEQARHVQRKTGVNQGRCERRAGPVLAMSMPSRRLRAHLSPCGSTCAPFQASARLSSLRI